MSVRARHWSVVALLAVVFIMTACSGEERGTPRPANTASSGSVAPGGSESLDYPKVQTPLDPTAYLQNPCELVPAAVLETLAQFDPGEPDVDSPAAQKMIGPRCTWVSSDVGGPTIGVSINTVRSELIADGSGGLEAEYRSKANGRIDHLEPVSLPGHPGNPAVIAAQSSELDRGSCPVTVGLSDELTFTVRMIHSADPSAACDGAQKVAAAVLDTLAGGK